MKGRSWKLAALAVLGLAAFATGIACGDLEDALINAECYSDSDCGPLICVVATGSVATGEDGSTTVGNATALGWCRDGGACAPGVQPFCECVLDAASKYYCQATSDYERQVSATVPCFSNAEQDTCYCVPPTIDCAFPVMP